MALKILHTADTHIGMSFSGYPEIAAKLIEARFEGLKRLVKLGNDRHCSLFVVAGDLFNSVRPKAKAIDRVAKALAAFSGCALVLPGNHDYFAPATDELWKKFSARAKDNVLFLGEQRVYDLRPHGIDAAIYPAPCDRKHSDANVIGWITGAERHPEAKHHVAIAHGSVEGLSLDAQGDYFPMTRAELGALSVDLVLLGHTHQRFPEKPGKNDRVFMPGVAEPDGMDCRHSGTAWLHELGDDGSLASELLTDLGRYRFVRDAVELASESNIEALAERVDSLDPDQTLLDLDLCGRLTDDARARLEELLTDWQKRFAWSELHRDCLQPHIDMKTVDAEYPEGSFAHSLLSRLAEAAGDDEVGTEALQVAYELLQQAKVAP